MKRWGRCYVGSTIVVLALSTRAEAQEPDVQKAEDQVPQLAKFGKVFTRPLHPVVETIAPGGWIGAGISYDHPSEGPWKFEAKTLATPRRYWLAQVDAEYVGERVEAAAYGRARDMTRLNFFGLGPDTSRDDRTTFTLSDRVTGVFGAVRVVPAVSIGGRVEEIWPQVDRGRDPLFPSLAERFSDIQAPGLITQPRFTRYQTTLTVVAPASSGVATNQGGVYRIGYDIYDDQELNRFDFHRLELEGRHQFTVWRPYHTLTVHGWLSSAEPAEGSQVPFYFQHTLGGTSTLRSLHDALVGGDGTAATLRAYTNLRFRDNQLLLLQAEYRIPVWGPIDASVFYDTGKAVPRRSDLGLSGLKHDYGFSVSLMKARSTVARMDVAFGEEGPRFFVNVGGLLP
jgi:hypothetical protein